MHGLPGAAVGTRKGVGVVATNTPVAQSKRKAYCTLSGPTSSGGLFTGSLSPAGFSEGGIQLGITFNATRGPTPPPEDDRALARMLGCALLVGLAAIAALIWLIWRLVS